jgi:predicted XRE-type DNA-binding protein
MKLMKKKEKDRNVYKSAADFSISIGLCEEQTIQSKIKAKLVAAIRKQISRKDLSHEEVANMAGVARSNITGIISGSVRSVTVDRLIRIAAVLGLTMDLEIKKSA